MSRSEWQRVDDMLDAIAEIGALVARGAAAYKSDPTLRRALERCLEIVGEASKSLSDPTRGQMPGVPWADVIRLRDRLSHHYHRVDPDQLWAIAVGEIPGWLWSSARGGWPERFSAGLTE